MTQHIYLTPFVILLFGSFSHAEDFCFFRMEL